MGGYLWRRGLTRASIPEIPFRNVKKDRESNLRLTHEQSIFSYFNISSDFLSLFLNLYTPLNLD